ncbi:MAG: hypothetical protein RDV41_15000, partial [Planctomycetota bacterium]|nr:hypothetical protein [Planctomycetota bacterium]
AEEYDEVDRAPGTYGRQNMLAMRMSERLGVTFIPISYYITLHGTGGHDGSMVPVLASGPGAEKFAGMQDDTNIGKQLKSLLSPK